MDTLKLFLNLVKDLDNDLYYRILTFHDHTEDIFTELSNEEQEIVTFLQKLEKGVL